MRSLATAIALLLFCNACFASHTIRPADLGAFDGYAPDHQAQSPLESAEVNGVQTLRTHLLEPGVLRLRDARDGEWFDFDPESEFRITADGREFGWGRLQSVQISDHTMHARLADSSDLQAPLESVERAESRKFSLGGTVALTVGIGLGIFLGLALYGLANFHCQC